MKNLEQIRANYALRFWNLQAQDQRDEAELKGENGGDVIRGLASLIINNGLLATLAFAKEKGKGYEKLMENVGAYLETPEINVGLEGTSKLDNFIAKLCETDSLHLQRITAETLAYLSYLKRLRN